MTEQQYADFISDQRRQAREALHQDLVALRRKLWPPRGLFHEDPIAVEDRRRRDRALLELRHVPVITPPSILKVVNPA